MKRFVQQHHRFLFYFTWLALNLIQAGTTGLFDDEAYYNLYAKFLAWGYFDHPPMIAWLIKSGSYLFAGELGVRFFIVLMNTATLFLIERLLYRKDAMLFYAICGSLVIAQIGGIIAVPDLPLLFFVSLYFNLYSYFSKRATIIRSLILGIGIACMLYSKYHGVLIVFFTLLSDLSLFKKYQTYIVMLTAILLLSPHLYWQYQHDFPSVQYHLFERNASSYHFSFTTDYILGQLALAGPIAGWLLLWAAFRQRAGDTFQRALKFSLVGMYIFFLLSSLKGRVEANWTVPAFIPLIILSHQYLFTHARLKKILYYTLPVTLLFVFGIRIFMAVDTEPVEWAGKDEFHGNEEWVNDISKHAGGLPVVIINSYQNPSKYWFYSGKTAMALNTPAYRRNNYNFWPVEDSLIGKPVYVLGTLDSSFFNTPFNSSYLSEYGGREVDNYYSFSKIQLAGIHADMQSRRLHLHADAKTPATYLPVLQQHPYDTATVYIAVMKDNKPSQYLSTGFTVKQLRHERQSIDTSLSSSLPKGTYRGKLAISSCIPGQPSLNSTGFSFVIK